MLAKRDKIVDLDLLSETIDLMNKAENFQVISDIIFNFIQNFVNYNMAVIYRFQEKKKILEMVSCIGADVEKMRKRMPFRLGESAVGLVAKDKKALLIHDALNSKEIRVRQYYEEDPLIRSFLAVPLIVGDRIIGILSVSSSKPHEYNKYDVKMINIIASQGAVLLELNNNISQAKKFSNRILENVNSGVMVIDGEYTIISFNKSAEGITGYSCEELVGKNIRAIPLKNNGDEGLIVRSMIEGKIFFEEPGYLIKKDGSHVNIRLSTSLIYDDNGILKNCISIFRDTTQIEKLQRQVAMADKLTALGRLTSSITHEIRNPLLPIRNASEYLINKYTCNGNEELIKLLTIIREESERLNTFLQDLLNLNRDSFFSPGQCELGEILRESIYLLNYVIKEKDISLSLDIAREKIFIQVNKDNLKQVFINLLLNAIDGIISDKIKSSKEIRIKVEKKKNFCHVIIHDTGIGIDRGELDKIFEPFYTTKSEGTGLGLPIIHNIINSCGGEIFVDSVVNEATRVTLLLPLVETKGG